MFQNYRDYGFLLFFYCYKSVTVGFKGDKGSYLGKKMKL